MEEDRILEDKMPEDRIEEEKVEAIRPVKSKKGRRILVVLLAILLAAGAGFGGGLTAVYYFNDSMQGFEEGNSITINTTGQIDRAEAIAAKVIPSVVGISTTAQVPMETFFGMQRDQLIQGVGTGFIISRDGFILTNSHVVDDGNATTIIVQLTDGREMDGVVLWSDPILDLAIVKIEATNLTAAELGDSDSVNIGAYAAAIGNPLGLAFDRSVTEGVISGLDRTIMVGNGVQSIKMEGLMQTDASINSGNSGGPLLNGKGQVIGINSAKAASGEGLGFAIPINTAKPMIEEVMETGVYKKAFIGIGGADVELYLQYYPDADIGTKEGAYISQIYQGSPADFAGLKEGDVITALDEKPIKSMNQLTRELFSYDPGDKVSLSVIRNRQQMTVSITLGTMPQE